MRHQAQLSYDRRTAQASARELEEKISLSAAALQGLRESLRQAEAAKLQAEAKGAELLQATARAEAELRDARAEIGAAIEETRTEREAREALQAELAALREKYSVLKRRFVDAGKKVRDVMYVCLCVFVCVCARAHDCIACTAAGCWLVSAETKREAWSS